MSEEFKWSDPLPPINPSRHPQSYTMLMAEYEKVPPCVTMAVELIEKYDGNSEMEEIRELAKGVVKSYLQYVIERNERFQSANAFISKHSTGNR